MNFIITRFLRMIGRDYGFSYTLTRNPNGIRVCCITGIPEELKIKLANVKYSFVTGLKEITDKHGNLIRTEDITQKNSVCDAIYNPLTGVHGIRVLFGEDDYAIKVNKLDYEMRRYFESHSQIDEINHRS